MAALMALGLAAPCRAGGTNGATPFNFIFLDANARPVALGGAYAALANDANALLYNPAGLGGLQQHEATLMHNSFFQGLSQEYGAVAYKLGADKEREEGRAGASRGWGAMVDTLSYGTLQRTTLSNPDGAGLGGFGLRDWVVAAGYGRKVTEGLSIGAAGKGFYEAIDNVSVWAPAADIGLLYDFGRLPLSVGAAVQNLGPRPRATKGIQSLEELPFNVRAGLACHWSENGLVAFDVNEPKIGSLSINTGVEYVALKRLAVRLGYNGRNEADSGITMGFGLSVAGASVDYAFVPYGDLGQAHRLSLSLRWGSVRQSASSQAAAKTEPLRAEPGSPEEHFAKAQAFIDASAFDKAREELAAARALLGKDDGRLVRYYERMGAIALSQKDFGAAQGAYLQGLRIGAALGLSDTGVAEVYAGMGACLLAQGRTELAKGYLNKALELGPSLKTRWVIKRELRELQTPGP